MKPLTDTIHRTPWWALLLGGLVMLVALAAFVTPYHIIDYRKDAHSPEQKQAIKREIDNAFADNAIEIARGVLRSMRSNTRDDKRRDEIDDALEKLDQARTELRDADREAQQARREAVQAAREAEKEAAEGIREAQKEAEAALKEAGVQSESVRKAVEESLETARKAQQEARIATEAAIQEATEEARSRRARIIDQGGKRRIVIGNGDKPMLDIELDSTSGTPAPPAPPATAVSGVEFTPPTPPTPPTIILAPELRTEIHRNVTQDLYRIVTGAGLVLLFIPLFIVTIVSKFFIDRSRAALRMADLKRKEAEYHRMSQQVTAAKLSALQAQVEPHFLYNTLASVQALTEVDPQRASDMTGHLIQYLRNALPKMRESVSTVGQEVELVRAYLNILQMRMGKRLAFAIDVPVALNEMAFPPLMLPSLVENAIKHGLEPQREGGEVRISAAIVGERLRMVVCDTGRGFGETETVGTGVGLANIRERLATMYGDRASLSLEANQPHGVIATIEVPRDGAMAGAPAAGSDTPGVAASFAGPTSASEAAAGPRTRTQKVMSAMGTAERAWRKSLSFAFVVLVAVAAVLAGLMVVALATGLLPAQMGIEGPGAVGAIVGTAGVAVAFAAVVAAIAVVLAVLYGLGFLFVGLAIFIPIVIAVGVFPALSPFILLGLGIWWLVRRNRLKRAEAAASFVEPTLGSDTFAKGSDSYAKGSDTYPKGSDTLAARSDSMAKPSPKVSDPIGEPKVSDPNRDEGSDSIEEPKVSDPNRDGTPPPTPPHAP